MRKSLLALAVTGLLGCTSDEVKYINGRVISEEYRDGAYSFKVKDGQDPTSTEFIVGYKDGDIADGRINIGDYVSIVVLKDANRPSNIYGISLGNIKLIQKTPDERK